MRFLRAQQPRKNFFCALCRAPRTFQNGRHLKAANFLQIAIVTTVLTWSLFPWLEWKTLGSFFIMWAGFEFIRKTLYRKEVKCPYCGFDATWYRKDVRIARQQVEDFVKDNPKTRVYRHREEEEQNSRWQ